MPTANEPSFSTPAYSAPTFSALTTLVGEDAANALAAAIEKLTPAPLHTLVCAAAKA